MKNIEPIPVIVFFGATASGKTEIASNLFSYYNSKDLSSAFGAVSLLSGCAEIISADSVQVYKGLQIGSAAPSESLLADLPHSLISLIDPCEEFSAADFVVNADKICEDIYLRGKLPVILGGNAFFIKNFIYGLPITPKADIRIRNALQQRAKTEGSDVLYAELKIIDCKTAERIHPNDTYRIIRALEVFKLTGKPLSFFSISNNLRNRYNFFIVYFKRDRSVIYNRIDERVDNMINAGLYNEIYNLCTKFGCKADFPAMKAIGYKEFFDKNGRLKPEIEIFEIAENIKLNTKHYAKRQETFFNSLPCKKVYNADDMSEIQKLYFDILNFYISYMESN